MSLGNRLPYDSFITPLLPIHSCEEKHDSTVQAIIKKQKALTMHFQCEWQERLTTHFCFALHTCVLL